MARHRSDVRRQLVRPRTLIVLAVAATGLAAAVWLPARNDVASAGQRFPDSFSDDFGDDRGSRLDRTRWLVAGDRDRDGGRDGSRDSVGARQDGRGRLVLDRLAATRRAFTQPFGHAEASIKVERERGPWRAFGVIGRDGRVLGGDVETIDPEADPTSGDDFHTYTIDWTPEEILWSVDGRPSVRLERGEPGKPLAVVLNLATRSRSVVDFVKITTSGEAPPSTAPTGDAPTEEPTAEPTSAAPTSAAPTSAAPTTPPPATAPPTKAWATFTDYKAGDLVTFEGATYRVKETHTSLPGWQPTALPALFEKV